VEEKVEAEVIADAPKLRISWMSDRKH